MTKIELAELLQQDIKDLKSLFNYENHGLTQSQAKMLSKGIVKNLECHIEELVKR